MGPEGLSVADLADMLAVAPAEIVKFLFMRGIMVQMNSTLDPETVKATGLVSELGVRSEWRRVGWRGLCVSGGVWRLVAVGVPASSSACIR